MQLVSSTEVQVDDVATRIWQGWASLDPPGAVCLAARGAVGGLRLAADRHRLLVLAAELA